MMNGMSPEVSEHVPICSTKDIVTARQKGRELAHCFKFSKGEQTRFATAISELTRNILTYADTGSCQFYVYTDKNYHTIMAKIIDHGPGIENPKLAMTDGYSSGNGLGLGLPGAKRLVHELSIKSEPGLTQIEITIRQKKY
ncbi:MAG: ATP-binding protein [Litorilituus sp.]|nr:ATP-binding protein [Litorilituus sp.]